MLVSGTSYPYKQLLLPDTKTSTKSLWDTGTSPFFFLRKTGSCTAFFWGTGSLPILSAAQNGYHSRLCYKDHLSQFPDWDHQRSRPWDHISYVISAAGFMLGDLSGVSKIFVITGRTDMWKSFDGLMAIIRDTYELDPYANAVYLFCGRDSRKLKALHFDKDGFVLLQKRLDASGIPAAYGRSFHRSAQSNQRHRQKKRFLILCAKQRILNFLYPWQQAAARHLSTAFFFSFECDVDETQKNICFKTAGGYLS